MPFCVYQQQSMNLFSEFALPLLYTGICGSLFTFQEALYTSCTVPLCLRELLSNN